jgi:hypothetical protein
METPKAETRAGIARITTQIYSGFVVSTILMKMKKSQYLADRFIIE